MKTSSKPRNFTFGTSETLLFLAVKKNILKN